MGDVQYVPIGSAHFAQLLDVVLGHGLRREGELLGPLQHGPFHLGKVGFTPVVLDVLGNEVIAAHSTQGPCVGDSSIGAVGRQRRDSCDRLPLRRGQAGRARA